MARRPGCRAAQGRGCSRRPQHVRRAAGPHALPSGPSGCADAAVRPPPGPGAGKRHGALPGPPDPAAGRRSPRPPPPAHLQLLPCTTKRPGRACRAGKCAWGDPVSARSSVGPQGRPAGLASGSNCLAVHSDAAHSACKPTPPAAPLRRPLPRRLRRCLGARPIVQNSEVFGRCSPARQTQGCGKALSPRPETVRCAAWVALELDLKVTGIC